MTGSKVFLDTTPLIYLLEDDVNFGQKTEKIFAQLAHQNKKLISSVITCTEFFVQPCRENNLIRIQAFWEFVQECEMPLYPIDMKIALKAAEIRAEYKFKAMDSLQLATACMSGCDLFLTNDKQLKQFKEISCVTVEEWNF